MVNPQNRPYDLSCADHDFVSWFGPPLRTLLICTQPRSGSTLLGEAIYFSGGLGCPLEYFHAGFRPKFEARWNVHSLLELRDAVWRNRTSPSGVLSIKLMWRDIQELAMETDPEGLRDIVEESPEGVSPRTYESIVKLLAALFPSSTFVHLFRRDRVRQAVSASIAEQTGQFRSIPGAEMPRLREPEYNAAMIERQIAYADYCNKSWRNLLSAMPSTPITITYEDLASDYGDSVSKLLRQLGSMAATPSVRMRRQGDTVSEGFVLRYLMEKGVAVR